MLISYKWLQTYFDQELPESESLADILNYHAFEVENIKRWDTDDILDLKILADRACYALSHRGIAKEVAAASNLRVAIQDLKIATETLNKKPKIEVKKPALCGRYIGRRVENVKIGKSPEWLVERLESIGERSINNIVDLANFVMFDIGQPLHAFDADKIKGKIQIRPAKNGEKMTTLDNREAELDSSVLVIADDEGPLAIAGIKGGKRAEVTESTENLILESANFNKSSIRLTSTILELKTSAARRFEVGLSPELALEAMNRFSSLITQTLPDAKFGPINDIYKRKQKPVRIEITSEFVNSVLGADIAEENIIQILQKLDIEVIKKGPRLIATPPYYRLDLNSPEDMVEEVGRVYGYQNIPSVLPPPIKGRAMINKSFYYIEKIKNILTERGFNEVVLYTFTPKGYFEVAKPLAEDKKFLRENLSDGIADCLKRNSSNAPILGLSEIRLFEIGRVFGVHGERIHICIGRQTLIKKDRGNEDILREIINLLGSAFNLPISSKISTGPSGAIAELDITDLFVRASSPNSYNELDFERIADDSVHLKFKPFSLYPFMLRDIAVWMPSVVDKNELLDIIKKEAGELLQRADLFDTFSKDGKVSYAYHLVFQSKTKTLTDSEMGILMERIVKEVERKEGWQVR